MPTLPRIRSVAEYYGPRSRWAAAVVLLVMAVLLGKLWHLQLVLGESYEEMSQKNRVRVVRLLPSRGRILDTTGRVLADNAPAFTLATVRADLEDPRQVVDVCGPLLGLAPEKMRKAVEQSSSVPRFLSYPLKRNLTLEEVSLVKSRTGGMKGLVLEVKSRRFYPLGQTLCHVIGILGEISAPELSRSSHMGYKSGDLLGKTGIEKQYEAYLKGVEGWEQIEIDAKGRQLSGKIAKQPESGADLMLTVDAALQQYIESIFIHRAGAVVVVDADNGHVLAMLSKPGFDLNLFSQAISRREWDELSRDPLHPFENRAIRGLYSPASTFKMVTAAAALAEHEVTEGHEFVCKGELELGGQVFRCWNRYGHGRVSLRKAIVESCDIYFYHLGLRLGVDRIARYASLFGLGRPTGLGLPQELPGLVPTSAWKLRTLGESWKDGETLNLAIGQGYLVATPIQIAMMTAAVANGGRLLKPSIVKRIQAGDGRILFDHAPVVQCTIPLSPEKMDLIKDALVGVVYDGKGTGRRCRITGIKVGGKTGTSQVIRHRQRTEEYTQVPYHERAHAIFVAYVDNLPKRIVVVVVVEHGGGGGKTAAPLARKIICKYYGLADPGEPEEVQESGSEH